MESVKLYEEEKSIINEQKRMINELKRKFDKEDQCPKIARFYLEEQNWNISAALEMYRSDSTMIMKPTTLDDLLQRDNYGVVDSPMTSPDSSISIGTPFDHSFHKVYAEETLHMKKNK